MSNYASGDLSKRLLYQVTLASGRIVTSPEDFGDGETRPLEDYYRPVFAEDGRLLTAEADGLRRQETQPPETQPQETGAEA